MDSTIVVIVVIGTAITDIPHGVADAHEPALRILQLSRIG